MQKYEKEILQCILAEKEIPITDLKNWPFFQLLKTEFIPQIHMVMVYSKIIFVSLFIIFFYSLFCYMIITYAMVC